MSTVKKRYTKTALLSVLSVFFGLTGAGAVIPAMMTVMIFDAPGSQDNPLTWGLFLGMISYPALAAVSIPAAWILRFFQRETAGLWVVCAPLLGVAIVAIDLALLSALCDGSFACR